MTTTNTWTLERLLNGQLRYLSVDGDWTISPDRIRWFATRADALAASELGEPTQLLAISR